MGASIKNYFTCANSSKGFCNFFDSNLQGLNNLYILKGGPGTGKSTLMKKIGAHFYDLGYDIEFITLRDIEVIEEPKERIILYD